MPSARNTARRCLPTAAVSGARSAAR
jgi:hypothetical protein